MYRFLFTLLCCLPLALFSQSAFNADYRMPDGVYLSHAAFLAAEPDLEWSAIKGEMVQVPLAFRLQVAGYGYKDESLDEDLLPYAVSLDGEPYLFVHRDASRGYYEFAGLRVVGAISVIRFDTSVHTRQLMKAYNPINGQPFREAWVERDKRITLTKAWHLPTGRIIPLGRHQLLPLIASDAELSKALKEVEEADSDLLLRAVKLYDDRVPLYLPATPEN